MDEHEHVAGIGAEYLGKCLTPGWKATLVEMLEYIDYYERVGATLDEINVALRRCPAVFVQRIDGKITFASSGDSHEITAEEITKAVADYHEDFSGRYEKLTGHKLRLDKSS